MPKSFCQTTPKLEMAVASSEFYGHQCPLQWLLNLQRGSGLVLDEITEEKEEIMKIESPITQMTWKGLENKIHLEHLG